MSAGHDGDESGFRPEACESAILLEIARDSQRARGDRAGPARASVGANREPASVPRIVYKRQTAPGENVASTLLQPVDGSAAGRR